MSQSQNYSPIFSTIKWFGVFTILIFGKIVLIWRMAEHYKVHLFTEGSPLEWLQFSNLVLAAVVTGIAAWKVTGFRQLLALLAMLPLVASIREQDDLFKQLIPVLSWKAPFYLVVLIGLIYGIINRKKVYAQLLTVINHRSIGILWAGFMVAIPFAQMVGHKPFIADLFGIEQSKVITRTIEEASESIGYLIIFFGLIDLCMYCYRKKQADALPRG